MVESLANNFMQPRQRRASAGGGVLAPPETQGLSPACRSLWHGAELAASLPLPMVQWFLGAACPDPCRNPPGQQMSQGPPKRPQSSLETAKNGGGFVYPGKICCLLGRVGVATPPSSSSSQHPNGELGSTSSVSQHHSHPMAPSRVVPMGPPAMPSTPPALCPVALPPVPW